ncbi:restriction endonuclease subunit S [Staphylococcus aureus]|uniref:Type I restriction-modification system, specificity subunit S n=3 Tax=Staphylococcus aureus TaxID=1280 RepID=A0A6C0NFT0_STAAU|nr:restriction endonuclease subunit S [Staphylococcus aureus]MBU8216250.1 restriction endonuclease subunit S [Staphylococcus aureus]MBU8218693.1 restriction endonuclease subunit S [Staphylococcus aureus]MBU8224160.1 restriction endonuclease subunit S [Staphylococcus aureus]MBV2988182.1 restriction endonuclease subunit S [Staphylococcus aureus]MBX7832629.1 restriction endonuclease subunit S [Staphylococcus aureus]
MEFKNMELGQIASITKLAGYEFTKDIQYIDNGEIIAIRALNVKNGKLDLSQTKRISKDVSNKLVRSKLFKNEIVLTYTGSKYGEVALVNENDKFHLAPNVCKITVNDNNIIPYYVLLIMQTFDFKMQLKNHGVGSSQPTIPMKNIRKLQVAIPSISYQKEVLRIIEPINKKIELNQGIIANLEELSQTLFKRWFVDFEFPDENGNPYKSSGGEMIDSELGEIPLNWKCSKIKDINVIISDHVANGSFKSLKENVQFTEDLNDKYAVFARNVDLKKGDNRFEKYVTKSSYEFLRKSHLHGHEVIISNVGDVGSVYLSPILNRPMVLGNNQIFINSDEKSLNYYFYLFFKSSIGKNLIDSITSGSVQMKFNKTDLRNSLIVFPCKNDMNNLITVIKKYIYSIENKKSENMQLIQLRDTLLPKLMSGEIEIPDDIEVNEDELSI